jgi:hypothetical protein
MRMIIETNELKTKLQYELDTLRQWRNELRRGTNLAAPEARVEWSRIENCLRLMQEEVLCLKVRAKEATGEVERIFRDRLARLRARYERLRHER